jgi:hypothetical protein
VANIEADVICHEKLQINKNQTHEKHTTHFTQRIFSQNQEKIFLGNDTYDAVARFWILCITVLGSFQLS